MSRFLIASLFTCALSSNAQPILSSNGYSGQGLTPSANVIGAGTAAVSFDSNIPGSINTKGYNTQVGLGLYEGLELVGKLATNDQKCNMFVKGACPTDMIRDFSTSLKWQLPFQFLKEKDSAVAIGITDLGGAANYFRSYYAVGTKSFGPLDLNLGIAKASGQQAILGGAFGSVLLNLNEWTKLKIEHLNQGNWISASVQKQIPSTDLIAYLTLNSRISGEPTTEKKWVGVGVTLPLDVGSVSNSNLSLSNETTNKNGRETINKKVKEIEIGELYQELEAKGFWSPAILIVGKRLQVEVENSGYSWNMLDAAGVSLGVLSGIVPTKENSISEFELTLKTRGVPLAKITGDLSCVRAWLEKGDPCAQMKIESALQRKQNSFNHDSVALPNINSWKFRPELVLSPTVVSSVGTEYGSFNMDMGLNVNSILPLWGGATIETNRVIPLGIGTSQFEQGGVFYGSRIKPNTSRTLLHQLFSIPYLNSQIRVSTGTAYTSWRGSQIESSTQSDDGRHRLGLVTGDFKNEVASVTGQKNYALITYRYSHGNSMERMTEITQGKYWAGDSGWTLGQKFWYGDTSLSVYMRRTKMAEKLPLVSFAGIQISLPITQRSNKGFENLTVRGTSQWTYSLESRILSKENLLTGGFGELPKLGESLITTFNRDRNSTHYFDMNLLRVRDAYLNL